MSKIDNTSGTRTTWRNAPTKFVGVDGVPFAYRELGPTGGVPVVSLHHLTAVLDDWDPRVIDGVAQGHHVIAFDNRGVGATGGSVPTRIEQMGQTLWPSFAPSATRRWTCSDFRWDEQSRRWLLCKHPNWCESRFSRAQGPEAAAGSTRWDPSWASRTSEVLWRGRIRDISSSSLERPKGRRRPTTTSCVWPSGRKPIVIDLFLCRHGSPSCGRAIVGGGKAVPDDLSVITHPTFVANGDHDIMVASEHSADLARRLPNSQLRSIRTPGTAASSSITATSSPR